MADPMSEERLAEIRVVGEFAAEHLEGDGSATEQTVENMPEVLAEVERLRAELNVARDGLKVARQMIGDALHATPDARSWEQLRDNILQKGRALKNAQALVSQRAGEREEANGRANRALEAIVKAEAERDEVRDVLVRELRASSYFRTAWKSARRGRKQAREQVKRVREVIAPADWEHAQVYARKIREALNGGEQRG